MTTELIERLAAFDAYVERLRAHDFHLGEVSKRLAWSKKQIEGKELQELMKAQHQAGNPYPMQAYWAFIDWAHQHGDDFIRDQKVQSIRNDLATEAVTQLINPPGEPHDP